MGRRETGGGVTPRGDRIQIRFSWRGQELRPTLPLKPTAANLRHAARLRQSILDDIRAGTFDLAAHFPDYRFAHRHAAGDTEANRRTFADWVEVWSKLAARDLEHSTLRIYQRHIAAYWTPAFGTLHPARVSHEKVLGRLAELAAEHQGPDGEPRRGLSRKTQNNILIPLRGVFGLICRTLKIADPTEGIDNLKVQVGNPDPFSPAEIEAALAAVRKHESDEAADYFEFAAFAGLRTSEQIALLWRDVDLVGKTVRIHRARVMAQDKERTKTAVERTVELNGRAAAALERQRARTQLAGGAVFRNPVTGRPWNDDQEQRRMWARVLRLAGVRYRPPKELRDTSVTLALQAGAAPAWVAAQHGHSLQVMLKSYAKWMPQADQGRNLAAVNAALGATVAQSRGTG